MYDTTDISPADLAHDAIQKWESLTQVKLDQTTFRFGDLDIHRMNQSLIEAMDLDPDGVTALMLLEVFLRAFLEEKSFTAAEIMRDYERLSVFLKDAEKIFSLLQSDQMTEINAGLRARVRQGLTSYGAKGEDVDSAINDPDLIAILRRDALRSMERLGAYQFLDGEADPLPTQVFHHVHMAYDVNGLLAAVRDMPHSGIAVVLMRDPSHPDRSYFTFAMRNGGKVILFTDKTRPAYPGQADVLSARGGRGLARSFAARTDSNHFPYQIIPTSLDEKGDVVFEKEKGIVPNGPQLVSLMPIAELPAYQAIWLTMMLALIKERFWKQDWRAPELSYTGAMITDRSALIRGGGGALAMVSDYREIGLEPVQVSDLTMDALSAAGTGVSTHRLHAWIEARYRDRVSAEILNLKAPLDGSKLAFIPATEQQKFIDKNDTTLPVVGEVFKFHPDKFRHSFDAPVSYGLIGMADSDFGTEKELADDRLFIARKNMAAQLQHFANEEFKAREAEVISWFEKSVNKNIEGLLDLLRNEDRYHHVREGLSGRGYKVEFFRYDLIKSETFKYTWSTGVTVGERDYRGNPLCVLTEAKPTYRGFFTPRTAEHIALLAGCNLSDIPDVLHHWMREDPYVGNHLLNRIDPVEANLDNPWQKMKFEVSLYLSRRGHNKIMGNR